MTERTIRVRFAPSPTGYLHVGGARTALFNWLFARHQGGTFVLRIEDTDRERSSDAMTQAIVDGLHWLNLDWDEGPVHQADGLDRHRAAVQRLLDGGRAYRCFCSLEALEQRRRQAGQSDDAFRYDRHCLHRVSREESDRRAGIGEAFAVRFLVPPGESAWDDVVHGPVAFANQDIEDFILLRTDGTPTYNLAVVSDDAAMRITHVIRGDDHISNTPKQILLYRALDLDAPVFAHVPLILGPDGKRLSKRHGATAVAEYQQQGILPVAMVNFLALLGWSPGDDQEIFSIEELTTRFSLEGINKKSAVFDGQKLQWLNGQHFSRMPAAELAALATPALVAAGLARAEELESRTEWYHRLLDLLKVRARSVADIVRQAKPYLQDTVVPEPEAAARYWKDSASVAQRLELLRERWRALPVWEEGALERALRSLGDELGVGAGKLIHPTRVALTGAAVSPGIFEVVAIMGRERTLTRLAAAVVALRRPGGLEMGG